MEDSRTPAGGHPGVSPPAVLVVLHGMTSRHQPKLTQHTSPAAPRRCHKVRSELILVECWVRVFENMDVLKCTRHPLAGWQEGQALSSGPRPGVWEMKLHTWCVRLVKVAALQKPILGGLHPSLTSEIWIYPKTWKWKHLYALWLLTKLARLSILLQTWSSSQFCPRV